MIPFDFDYARPETPEEAARLYRCYARSGEHPLYYGGGSEIISMSRAGSIRPGAVIDLKGIPALGVLELQGDELVIGGCVTLRAITDSGLFPLLGKVCGRIADHTNQCRITLGGNLCATIPYRETAQALLIADADVVLHGADGARRVALGDVFDGRLRLKPGELVERVHIPRRFIGLGYNHIKKTGCEKIDYPLVSVSALNAPEGVRLAVSGYYGHPFRDAAMEAAFNGPGGREERLNAAMACLSEPPVADYQGSAEYRRFVLKNILSGLMEAWL